MDIKPVLNRLEQSKSFLDWKKSNKNTFFSYAFKIPQEMKDEEWQVGFYDKGKDKITTFIVSSNSIQIRKEEEMFKEEKTDVKKISLEKVKLSFDSVLLKAQEFQQNNFPKDRPIKTIAILQNLDKLGDIWNLTFITESFNTLNMKIDASNGKVREHKLSSVFEFRTN